MPTGTVRRFNTTEGFGFIKPDETGQDAFIHVSAIERASLPNFSEGQRVSYELVANSRSGKLLAEQVAVI